MKELPGNYNTVNEDGLVRVEVSGKLSRRMRIKGILPGRILNRYVQ